ncbi:Polypeptide deformylase, putative [Angomonas deanei]|uniref:Peptide deformylase n=1 Tax=Angomonas deanei TaxID=59799 RepID=A0A7G2CNW9_9TRYP|nr:Polypeptide deformylase, putative [Angomonas deanei]
MLRSWSIFSRGASQKIGLTLGTLRTSLRCHSDEPYNPQAEVEVKYPVVQMPARTLWTKQYSLSLKHLKQGDFDEMIGKVKETRKYYQYPSMSAPKIGWNVNMFTLFDDSVYINPVNLDAEEWTKEAAEKGMSYDAYEQQKMAALREKGQTGFAWEPCASCCFMMHYIERPLTVRIRATNEKGVEVTETLSLMRARMALHEMDHLQGILFYRRVVDSDHVVPLEGFSLMSDWSDDYPSLEARSTYLYTIFVPPYGFLQDPSVTDARLIERKFEDGVYPGAEHERRIRIESAAIEELQRKRWAEEKGKSPSTMKEITEGTGEEDTEEPEKEKS